MVTFTTAQYFLFIICGFLGLVAMPYATDYVFFVLDDESSWLRASIGASIIVAALVVIVVRGATLLGWV